MQWKKRNETGNFFRHGVSYFFQAALSKPKCGIPNTNDHSRITSNLICIPDHPQRSSSLLTLKERVPIWDETRSSCSTSYSWLSWTMEFSPNFILLECTGDESKNMPELPVVSQVHPREIRPKNDECCEIWICDLSDFFLLLKFFLKFSFQKVLSVLIRFEFFIVILLTHCLVLCSRALAKIAKCIPENAFTIWCCHAAAGFLFVLNVEGIG